MTPAASTSLHRTYSSMRNRFTRPPSGAARRAPFLGVDEICPRADVRTAGCDDLTLLLEPPARLVGLRRPAIDCVVERFDIGAARHVTVAGEPGDDCSVVFRAGDHFEELSAIGTHRLEQPTIHRTIEYVLAELAGRFSPGFIHRSGQHADACQPLARTARKAHRQIHAPLVGRLRRPLP